jgi:hypothetical protein
MAQKLEQLFLLNLTLQLFDGIATYQGALVWGEGNPLLLQSMAYFGVGSAVLLFKAKACGLLLLLRWRGASPAVTTSMTLVAVCYGVFSYVPWMARFLHLSLSSC